MKHKIDRDKHSTLFCRRVSEKVTFCIIDTCQSYYKHITIVSDAIFQSITLKSSRTLLEASFTLLEESFKIFIVLAEVVTIVNYDRNMFIV
jgi:hypothetical protein